MHSGRIVFSQLMDYLPRHDFNRCVARYRGSCRARRFSCLDQFLCMAFAQLTFRESLRDTVTCLRAIQTKLYHAGIRGRISRSTLADANEKRDWRIYADFAAVLIIIARKLYANEPLSVDLRQTAYVFDATTIDLCLSLFPWAPFRKHKAAIKLHTLMDLRGSIPCFISITDGKTNEKVVLDDLVLEPGAFYMLDRGFVDFRRLYFFTQSSAFFVLRAKRGLDYRRRSSYKVDKSTGLRSDQMIVLRGPKTRNLYPVPLRRVSFYDAQNKVRYVFLTNNFTLPALTISDLYKCRWQVELFFKWIKQNLRIKTFFGTSANAVKTQIWIAISVYVLVAITKKRLSLPHTLSEILQILSITLFEQASIFQVFTEYSHRISKEALCNQLYLFD